MYVIQSQFYTDIIYIIKENGYDRRCVYSDGDIEDLRVEDLERLAKLDPNNNKTKPRLSIKLNAKSKQPTDSKVDTTQTSNGGNLKKRSNVTKKMTVQRFNFSVSRCVHVQLFNFSVSFSGRCWLHAFVAFGC